MPEAVKHKILLADDMTESNRSLKRMLKSYNNDYDIRIALDGAQAIKAAEEDTPDIILLDIQMPIFNGFEVLQALRERKIATRVIIVTGEAKSPAEIVQCVRLGACEYIFKPIIVLDVYHAIERHLMSEDSLLTRVINSPVVENFAAEIEKLSMKNSALWSENYSLKYAAERLEKQTQELIELRVRCNELEQENSLRAGNDVKLSRALKEVSELRARVDQVTGMRPSKFAEYASVVIAVLAAVSFGFGIQTGRIDFVYGLGGMIAAIVIPVIPWWRLLRLTATGPGGTGATIELGDGQ
ncbi:response regulator [Tundrisphaera sp. TA3]|uniref:response regulator n=1 Tax=Tundrisphaera sp. TA3 TaxID=3435775 RepID=UPI003EBD337F